MKKLIPPFLTLLLLLLTVSDNVQASEKELIYRLKWLFNASVAGDIYGDLNGYFKRAGLRVKLKEGGPGKNAIKELELGQADFGVASADQVIRALDKGAKIKVIAQIFQINPMQWIYRENLGKITDLSQLKGKSMGVTFGGNDESIMNTLFAQANISRKDLTLHSARFDFTPFLTGKVQIWPVYRNSQGVILENRLQQEKEKVRFLNPAAFGVNFVANSVVTSEKMIDNHPETVAKFKKALLAAWTDAMAPPNEAKTLAAIAQKDKGNSDTIRKLQLQATRALVKAKPFGTIDIKAWTQTERIMLKENQIRKPVNIKNVLQL